MLSCLWDGAFKKDPLLLIKKNSPYSGGSGFPLLLSECPTSMVRWVVGSILHGVTKAVVCAILSVGWCI